MTLEESPVNKPMETTLDNPFPLNAFPPKMRSFVTTAKETLDVEEYRREMEGIYSTSVNEATLDEAPMAYKSLADIIDVIAESVDVIEVLKPIYNFKAN